MKEYQMTIEGMGCAHCVKRVTEALNALGAQVKKVELGSAAFAFDGDIQKATDAVSDCGFDVTAVTEA